MGDESVCWGGPAFGKVASKPLPDGATGPFTGEVPLLGRWLWNRCV
jgi:hypothetical protein